MDELVYIDVGPLLEQASAGLAVGQLLQVEGFSLFEAMSAVEIGNPKMDPGFRTRDVKAPLQLAEEGHAPLDITLQQCVDIMDHLLQLEATWHSGSSLAQTIYSSLYMLLLDRTSEHLFMSGFCKTLQATCLEVKQIIMDGCVAEEEDFNPHIFGLPLDNAANASQHSSCLAAADLALSKLSTMASAAAAAPAAAGQPVTPELVKALKARIGFRKALHQGLVRVQRKGAQDLAAAQKHFAAAAAELALIQQTAAAKEEQQQPLGYVEDVNCGLLPAAPPRQVAVLSKAAAFQLLGTLLQQLQHVCGITSVSSYSQLKRFVEAVARQGWRAVARSTLHLQLAAASWQGRPTPAWAPSLEMMCREVGIPAAGPLPGDVAMFAEQSLVAAGNYVQEALLNRSRQRRRLRRGLEDWGHMLQHGLNGDMSEEWGRLMAAKGWLWRNEDPQDLQGPMSTWVEQESALCMAQHLLLGTELQLYQPCEYCMLYWYLDYLHSCALAAMRQRLIYKASLSASSSASSKPSLSRSKKASAAAAAAQQQQVALQVEMQSEMLRVETFRLACQGTLRLCVGLKLAGLLPDPQLHFNSMQQRFDQRFACFSLLQRPEPLLYESYERSVDPGQHKAEFLLQLAADNFTQVRARVVAMARADIAAALGPDQVQLAKGLDRVAAQNLVTIGLLRRGLADGSALLPVALEVSPHCGYFPVLVVQKGKKVAAAAAPAAEAGK